MSDIRSNLKNIFKQSKVFTENHLEEKESTWDEIKKRWSAGKKYAQDAIKTATDNPLAAPINAVKGLGKSFGKNVIEPTIRKIEEPVTQKVQGTGVGEKPKNDKPQNKSQPISTNNKSQDKTIRIPSDAAKTKDNDSVKFNFGDMELQSVEDPAVKEKKIIDPLKKLLSTKKKDFISKIDVDKKLADIKSNNTIAEVSSKDPTDESRKTLLKDIFSFYFYIDSYDSLLKNLRKMKLVSEDKLDYGSFQTAILNSLEAAKEKYSKRYTDSIKSINNLEQNEPDVKAGMQTGELKFKEDMINLYKSNVDKFTMPKLEEGVKQIGFFIESITEQEDVKTDNKEDKNKEDDVIRVNDYVWWLDEAALIAKLTDPENVKKLTYKNQPFKFEKLENGDIIDGTTARIKFLKGPSEGQLEKIDIRNVTLPKDEKFVKSLVKFGKIVGSDLSKANERIKEINLELSNLSSGDRKESKLKAEKERLLRDVEKNKDGVGEFAKVQPFIAKDYSNLEKTLSSGGTKLVPESQNTSAIKTSILVKLNSEGKKKLLKIVAPTAIALYLLFGLIDPRTYVNALKGIDNKLKQWVDATNISGSKHETNF